VQTSGVRSPIRWLLDAMGDDGIEDDPEAIVEVGRVALWVSEIVIAQLADQGIRATSASLRSQAFVGNSQVRIYCAAKNADAARELIDEVTTP
jgi:hypothetical protein